MAIYILFALKCYGLLPDLGTGPVSFPVSHPSFSPTSLDGQNLCMDKITNLQPEQIAPDYLAAAEKARTLEPRLSDRLLEIYNWIRAKKPGEIRRSPLALRLLSEVLHDALSWLFLKEAEVEVGVDFRDELLADFTPAERYWYTVCFPAWFQEKDPKFQVWKWKLMSNQQPPSDQAVLAQICRCVERLEGSVVLRLIADLSMSTDIVCASAQGNGLCMQHTRRRGNYLLNKLAAWEHDLRDHWKIDRGILISCLPQHAPHVAKIMLHWCDAVRPGDYKMEELA